MSFLLTSNRAIHGLVCITFGTWHRQDVAFDAIRKPFAPEHQTITITT